MDAWSATYGQTAVDPAQAVIGMLNMAVFRANFYASLLEEQVLAAQEDRAELDAEEAGLPRAKGAPQSAREPPHRPHLLRRQGTRHLRQR